jgi:hypothetical protein
MSPREQLLKMQRIILRQLKASVHKLQGTTPPQIERYYQAYKREFRNYQKISNKSELLSAIRSAQIVFGGDFHPFAQSQRTHLRILRELVKEKRPLILAMEAIDSGQQKHLDLFLNGRIDERTFLRKVNYAHSWGFPWGNYKVIFDFAKEHGLSIYGINHSPHDRKVHDLALRDAHSAREIVKLRETNPGALIYVIYGDLHLASSHLPKLVKKWSSPVEDVRTVTIFQNSETLYWRLAKRRLEEKVDVLKLRRDTFCVVNAPPWLKWQAYLHFLENSVEAVDGSKEQDDYSDHILSFVSLIKKLWKVEGSFQDFHVYSQGEVKLANHLSHSLTKAELAWLEKLIQSDRSFFVPRPPTFYMSRFDVNHTAALAGQYLHAKLRREKKLHTKFPDDFSSACWIEAIGFFTSQLVNSRRKFQTLNDLNERHQVTLIVLEQKLREAVAIKTGQPVGRLRPHKGRKSLDYHEASRIIGALLGHKLYLAFHKGKLDLNTLRRWLSTPVSATPRFWRFYADVLRELRHIPIKERSKNERL